MKAMILAAGRGERMRPLTDSTPKPLLKIADKPMIVWHILRLKQVGITEIVINHAWLGKQIEQTLGNGANYGVKIAYSAEIETGLETAGGIANALDLLGDEPFLVVNGDILTDIDFQAAYEIGQNLLKNKILAHLWLVENPEHHQQGDFVLNEQGQIFSEGTQGKRATFSGVGVYLPELFENLAKNKPAKLAPILRQAMNAGRVQGQFHAGLWVDVGTVERLAFANQLVEQGKLFAK